MLDCNAVWVQFFSIKIKSRTVTYTIHNIIITQHHTKVWFGSFWLIQLYILICLLLLDCFYFFVSCYIKFNLPVRIRTMNDLSFKKINAITGISIYGKNMSTIMIGKIQVWMIIFYGKRFLSSTLRKYTGLDTGILLLLGGLLMK